MYLAGCLPYQKNGAIVRDAVGHARLVGVQAYHQLREVYRALRLVVNCFQPSLKLQAKVPKGERVRRVYDAAQTPLQRLLASGVLSANRWRELSKGVEQVDPLALSEQLDDLRLALLRVAHMTAVGGEGEFVLPLLRFSLMACTSRPLQVSEEGPAQVAHQERSVSRDEILNWPRPTHDPFAGAWEDPWPPELIQGDHSKPLPTEPHLLEEADPAADQHSAQVQSVHVPTPGTSSSTTVEHEAAHLAMATLEQAIAAYLQEMRACGRDPKTLRWHQTSLGALRRYLWRRFHLTDVCSLTRASLQTWLTELSLTPSARTGAIRTVNTVAAYARSARAFCNWLVRQGYVSETLFPKDAVPKAQRGLPQPLEPEAFVHLLRACQLAGPPGGQNAGMTTRNRAILWCRRTGSAPCAPIWIRSVSRRPGSPRCQRHGTGSCSPSGGIL